MVKGEDGRPASRRALIGFMAAFSNETRVAFNCFLVFVWCFFLIRFWCSFLCFLMLVWCFVMFFDAFWSLFDVFFDVVFLLFLFVFFDVVWYVFFLMLFDMFFLMLFDVFWCLFDVFWCLFDNCFLVFFNVVFDVFLFSLFLCFFLSNVFEWEYMGIFQYISHIRKNCTPTLPYGKIMTNNHEFWI